MDEKTLDEIQWRATRGSHFEGTFLGGSLYTKQVVEEDVPALLVEVRSLKAKNARLCEANDGWIHVAPQFVQEALKQNR